MHGVSKEALARSLGWSAKPTPPPLQPPDGQSLLAGAMCVKMMAGIAGILHINSMKSRDFWAPYENIREKKWLIFWEKWSIFYRVMEPLKHHQQPFFLILIGTWDGWMWERGNPSSAPFQPGFHKTVLAPWRLAGGDPGEGTRTGNWRGGAGWCSTPT